MLLLQVELLVQVAFFFSIDRWEARCTDAWVILCRRPASECRTLREQRAELRLVFRGGLAMGTLTALRPGESSSCWTNSADKRSSEEILTTTSGKGILGGDSAASHACSYVTPSAFVSSFLSTSLFGRTGFSLCDASASLSSTELFSSPVTSGFVCLFLRVVRFGCAVLLA